MALNDLELALVERLERILVDGRGPDGKPLTRLQRAIVANLRGYVFDLARKRERDAIRRRYGA